MSPILPDLWFQCHRSFMQSHRKVLTFCQRKCKGTLKPKEPAELTTSCLWALCCIWGYRGRVKCKCIQPESIQAGKQRLRFQHNRRRIESSRVRCRESCNGAQTAAPTWWMWRRRGEGGKKHFLTQPPPKLTRTPCSWAGRSSPTWSCSWCPSRTGSGSGPLCSCASSGWCCWRTPCDRRAARSARCRTRWRCRWAGRTPAAWAAAPSRAAQRRSSPTPSWSHPCTRRSGTEWRKRRKMALRDGTTETPLARG